MKFATLHDVARAAGVSYATVDRVVNKRGGVAEKSVQRVQDAVETLGYARDETAANLAKRRIYRFHFLLPDDKNDFFRAIGAAIAAQQTEAQLLRTRLQTTRMPAFSEAALIAALDRIDLASADCVCLVALDTPAVAAAVERAKGRGLKLVTLVSDIAATQRDHYIGIDNLVAGKTAGRMMGLAHTRRAGRILPIIGTGHAFDHMQRLDGFRGILAQHFAAVEVLAPVKTRDDAATVHREVTQAWASEPGLTGIYNIGGGNAGLIDWGQGIAPQDRPVIVVHELLPIMRAALEKGVIDAVIDQKPFEAVGEALRIMRRLVDDKPVAPSPAPITPAIYLCENLPPLVPPTNRMKNP